MKELYSVEELAEILSLHPKTVQRFIREGKIRGRKIGRSWMVHRDDLRDFAHAELASDPEDSVGDQTLYTGSASDSLSVSAVVELVEKEPEEASRLSNSFVAMLNCKDRSWGTVRFDMMYEPKTHTARFIFSGTPAFIKTMMGFFEAVRGSEE